jgi:hypothetical protein
MTKIEQVFCIMKIHSCQILHINIAFNNKSSVSKINQIIHNQYFMIFLQNLFFVFWIENWRFFC